jgi:hypothetical protein
VNTHTHALFPSHTHFYIYIHSVQEEYDRVVMQAEQRQLVLEKAAAQLHEKMVCLYIYIYMDTTLPTCMHA